WQDLTKSGVQVITPNPFTSGGARWNVLAGYGATSNIGKDEQAGVDYLTKLFKQVPVQDSSARASLQTFTSGKGDAILAYENEAILARQAGQAVDYTIPDKTILIENPVAVTKTTKHPKQAKAFVDFLYSNRAQQLFADNASRPASATATRGARHRDRCRARHDVPEHHRARPARRRRLPRVRQRRHRLLGHDHDPRGLGGAEADDPVWTRCRGGERGVRHAGRVGARPRPLRGQTGPRDAHRPAVRAADDRRRADPPRALRRPEPARHRSRVQGERRGHGAAVRDAPVRRPDRAARPAGARPGDGGGRGLARRVSPHHLLADRVPEPASRHR